MMRTTLVLVCLLCVGLAAPLGAKDDSFLRFDGGIGVIPVSNITVDPATNAVLTGTRNVVRGVNPPGQIWVISALKAEIDTDGHIRARGRGLLLGGGSGIGTNANQNVKATLICDAAGATLFNTATVPLAANGDFRIDDMLTNPTAMFPSTCASPVLLIRNAGNAWFAAGILDLDDDN
jgi:hypothetical protein